MSTNILSSETKEPDLEPDLEQEEKSDEEDIYYDIPQTLGEELELLESEVKEEKKHVDELKQILQEDSKKLQLCEGKTRNLQDEIKRYSTEKIINKPLDTTKVEETISIPTLDPKYETYESMKRRNIPEGAIRQKMQSDAVPSDEIDKVISILFPQSIKKEVPKAPEKSFWRQQDKTKLVFKKKEKKEEVKKPQIIIAKKSETKFEKSIMTFINSLKLNVFNVYKINKLIFTKKILFDNTDYEKLLNIILLRVNKKNTKDIEDIKTKFPTIFDSILNEIKTNGPNIESIVKILPEDSKLKPILSNGIDTYLKEKMSVNLDLLKVYKIFYDYILDYQKDIKFNNLNTKLKSWKLHLEKFKQGYFDNKETAKIYCEKLIKKEIPEPIKKIEKRQKNASVVETHRKKMEALQTTNTELNILINNDIFIQTLNELIEFCDDSKNTFSIEDFINKKILSLQIKFQDEQYLKSIVDSLISLLKEGDKNKNNINKLLGIEKFNEGEETVFISPDSIQFIKFFYDPNKYTMDCIKINESLGEFNIKFPYVLDNVRNLNDFLIHLYSFKENFSTLILALVAFYIKDKDKPPEFYPFATINSEILTSEKGKFFFIFVNSLSEIIKDFTFLASDKFINNIQKLSQFKIDYLTFDNYFKTFDASYKVLKINVEKLEKIGNKETTSKVDISKEASISKISESKENLSKLLTLKPPRVVDSGEFDGAGPPAFLASIGQGIKLKQSGGDTSEDKKVSTESVITDKVLLKYKEYVLKEFQDKKTKYEDINKIQKENTRLIKNIFELFGEEVKTENINVVINTIIKISNEYFKEYNSSKEVLSKYLEELNINPDGKRRKRSKSKKRRSASKRRKRSKSKNRRSTSKRRKISKSKRCSKSKRRKRSKSKKRHSTSRRRKISKSKKRRSTSRRRKRYKSRKK